MATINTHIQFMGWERADFFITATAPALLDALDDAALHSLAAAEANLYPTQKLPWTATTLTRTADEDGAYAVVHLTSSK